MALFFLFLLFSLTSATKLVHNHNHAQTTGLPVDSRNFFVPTTDKPHHPDKTALSVDSRNFFVPTLDTNAIPVDSRNLDKMALPVDSRNFFVPTLDTNAIPVDSSTFFVPTTTAFPIDSHNFFIPAKAKTTLSAYKVSYCSVYFKKDDLKKGTTLCPLFTHKNYTTNSTNTAAVIKAMRSICERPIAKGEYEYKFCASSYKVMAKNAISKLGNNFNLVSSDKVEMKTCTISSIKKLAEYGKAIICDCHKQWVPNVASFYCHQLSKSSVYILLVREKDRVAKKLDVCHGNTTAWNPKRLVFQVLHVKPGTPVCHLLPTEDLAWVVTA